MSLTNSVIKAGATAITVTGGTDINFSNGPSIVTGGKQLIVATDTYLTRRELIARARAGSINGMQTTKAKHSLTFVRPKTKVDGTIARNLVRIEVEFDPESTTAEIDDLIFTGAQLCGDTDYLSFWRSGTAD